MIKKPLDIISGKKIRGYLRNILITELMTSKNGTRDVIMKETPPFPL